MTARDSAKQEPKSKKPRKAKVYTPPVPLERMTAMLLASGTHAIGKATMKREMAEEIHFALRTFYDIMIAAKMASIRQPSRASRDDLVKARVALDLLAGWPVKMTPKVKKYEAVRAAFQCKEWELDNTIRNFDNLKRPLSLAHPVVESNVVKVWDAYERVSKYRKAKSK